MSGKMVTDKKSKRKTAKRLTTTKRKTAKKTSKNSPSFSMNDLLSALTSTPAPTSLLEVEQQKRDKLSKLIASKNKSKDKLAEQLIKTLSSKQGAVTKTKTRKSAIKSFDKTIDDIKKKQLETNALIEKAEKEKEEFEMMCDLADSFGHLGGYKYKKTIKKHKKVVKK